MHTAGSLLYGGLCLGGLPNRDPLDRDYQDKDPPGRDPRQRPPWTETPLVMWPVVHAETETPLWTLFLTHVCENITFPRLLLRAVINQVLTFCLTRNKKDLPCLVVDCVRAPVESNHIVGQCSSIFHPKYILFTNSDSWR